MQSVPRFSEMPYSRPSADDLNSQSSDLIQAWDSANSVEDQKKVIQKWDAYTAEYETNNMLARVHFQQQTNDPAAKVEQEYFDNLVEMLC